MKKLFFSSMLAMLCAGANTATAQVHIGPEVGFTYNTMYQRWNNLEYDSKFQLGFRLGGLVDIPISESKFYFQPGAALLINNGAKTYYEHLYSTGAGVPTSYKDSREYHVMSVNIPLYFVYKTGNYYNDPHFLMGLGGYVSGNVGGRFVQDYVTTLNGDRRSMKYDRSIFIGQQRADDDIAMFDAGVSAMLGFQASSGFFVKGYVSLGLLDQAPGNSSLDYFQNLNTGLTFGFLFNTKPYDKVGYK